MTKRKIGRSAIDPEHKRLMLAYRNARGGERQKAWKRLRDYMTVLLGEQ